MSVARNRTESLSDVCEGAEKKGAQAVKDAVLSVFLLDKGKPTQKTGGYSTATVAN